jgi:hypothetical protein
MPWEGGIICPKCGKQMVEDTSGMPSATGYEFKMWRCESGHAEAEARHPVQYPYIAIGQEDERQGVLRRVIKKDIIGAELYVFYETPVE